MDLNSTIMSSARLHHFVLVHCSRSAIAAFGAPLAIRRMHRSRARELVQYIVIMIICDKPLGVSW